MTSIHSLFSLQKNKPHRHSMLLLLLLLGIAITTQAQQCSVCVGDASFVLPDKALELEGLPVDNCQDLSSIAAVFTDTDPICTSLQSIGTLCDCPIPTNACTLCYTGARVAQENHNTTLSQYPAEDYFFGLPPGLYMTCQTLEAMLHGTQTNSSDTCRAIQVDAGEMCGCAAPPSNITTTTEGQPTSGDPIDDTNDVPVNNNICTVCRNGQDIALPDKSLKFGNSLPVENCRDLRNFAGLLQSESSECDALQGIGGLCGCPVSPDACSLCPNGESVPFPDLSVNWFGSSIGADFIPEAFRDLLLTSDFGITCELLQAVVTDPPPQIGKVGGGFFCVTVQLMSGACGCSAGWRSVLLVWAYRSSGFLSLCGSLLIIYHATTAFRKQRATYHQLILGICFFDCLSSISYLLGPVLLPEASGIYGSMGNDATCTLSGILIQLGMASAFYNLALSIYFMLAVCYNWREGQFQKWLGYIHVGIFTLALGIAMASIPFIGPLFTLCYIKQPPLADSWLPSSLLYTLPISLVLLGATASTLFMLRNVRMQQKRAAQWRMESSGMAVMRKVFWQCFWYLLAFYVTWPMLMVTYYLEYTKESQYWVFVVVAFLAPSQGLLNCLVYFYRSRKNPFQRLLCCGSSCNNKLSCLANKKSSSLHDEPRSSTAPPSSVEEVSGEEPQTSREDSHIESEETFARAKEVYKFTGFDDQEDHVVQDHAGLDRGGVQEVAAPDEKTIASIRAGQVDRKFSLLLRA